MMDVSDSLMTFLQTRMWQQYGFTNYFVQGIGKYSIIYCAGLGVRLKLEGWMRQPFVQYISKIGLGTSVM